MLKKFIALALTSLLLQVAYVQPVAASTRKERDARFVEKVKAEIARLGTGPDARIQVKLRDNSKLKGYISEVKNDIFVITDPQTGTSNPVAYPQVKQANGNNLSTGVKIAIGVGALVALGIILAVALK